MVKQIFGVTTALFLVVLAACTMAVPLEVTRTLPTTTLISPTAVASNTPLHLHIYTATTPQPVEITPETALPNHQRQSTPSPPPSGSHAVH